MIPDTTPVRAARQERSRHTLEALLDAAELLLQTRSFQSLSLAELVRTAGVTTGAFYGRFKAKDDLLPALYQRYLLWRTRMVEEEIVNQDWSDLPLATCAERAADLLCRPFEKRPWLLRAMAIHARQNPKASRRARPPSGDPLPQVFMMQSLCDRLEEGLPASKRLPRDELEFLVYGAITLAREMTLFPGLPMARQIGLDRKQLRARLTRMLLTGLTAKRRSSRTS